MVKTKATWLIIASIAILFVALQQLSLAPLVITDYRTATQLINDLIQTESDNPSLVSHEVVGTTVLGKNIYLFKIGNPQGGKVLVDASIHGNERATSETVYWFVDWLLTSGETDAETMLECNSILILPIVNVDSYGVKRTNAHGVDLNRNFETGWTYGGDAEHFSGDYPLSEPETQAIHQVLIDYQPDWYLNLHTGFLRVIPPWVYKVEYPEDTYFRAVYSNYSTLSTQRGATPIPYYPMGGYAGGVAGDEGYTQGAHAYSVELNTELEPTYQRVVDTLLPRFIPLMIVLSEECAIPLSSPPPQDAGNLNVVGYYDGTAVAFANCYYVGPSGSSSSISVPATGYTWYNVDLGSYTVSGTYNTVTNSDTVTVSADTTAYAQLDFGGSTSPPSPDGNGSNGDYFHLFLVAACIGGITVIWLKRKVIK